MDFILLKQDYKLHMSVNLTANTSVASDVTTGQETIHEGVISTLQTTPAEVSGSTTIEKARQNAPLGQLGNFFQRRTLLKRYTFTSGDPVNSSLDTFDPHGLFFSSVVIADKVKNFKAFRGTFRLTVTTTFPSGTYGLYCVSAVPEGGPVPTPGLLSGKVVASVLPFRQALHVPHALIRVENATDGVIDMDFIYPHDYTDIGTAPKLWTVYVWCLSPVLSAMADATLTGTCTIYGEFLDDFEMFIPVQQGKKESAGSRIKHTAGTISSVAGALSGVPIIGELAAPIAAGAAAVSGILDFFGFTRTTHQKTPEPFIPRMFSNVANIDVEDTSEVCALSVSNTVSFDPRIGGGEETDPAAFEQIYQHWTQVEQFTWNNAQTAGTVIGTFNVSPFFTNSAVAHNSFISLTAAGYVGLPFSYWRGDMEYMVIIPVSMFHRGKLQFVWSLTAALGTHDPTNQLYNIIMDVTAQSDLTFTVGYSKVEPTARSHIHSNTFPSIVDTTTFNGTVSVVVVNQLTCPVDTAPTTVRIYARACPNMTFGVPKSVEHWRDFTPANIIQNADIAWFPQGAVGDGERSEISMELVPSPGPYPVTDMLWGEEFKSARALMQKMDAVLRTVTNFSWFQDSEDRPTFNYIFAHFPNFNDNYMMSRTNFATYNDGDTGGQFTYAAWYKYLFVGIAGSTRYKIMSSGTYPKLLQASSLNFNVGAYNVYGAQTSSADVYSPNPTLSADTVIKPHEGYEFTIPYYAQQKFYHCRFDPALHSGVSALPLLTESQARMDIVATHIMGSAPAANNLYGNKIFRGMGPDLRLVKYRFPPNITNSNATTDTFARQNL